MIEKLTKKQKKGLAFRQKKGKSKQDLGGDLPAPDLEDELENITEPQQLPIAPTEKTPSKKRKRDDTTAIAGGDGGQEAQPEQKSSKRRKSAMADGITAETTEQGEEKGEKANVRFILFVGNLKYTTSKEAILDHFSKCDPPPTVRLLTPKSSTTAKSKGCAFLEFTHRNALQQALKLHQSELQGRNINVELTAGGGGKSEKRIQKVKERNRGLASQRTKQVQKQNTSKGGAGSNPDAMAELTRPQRHSTTSGIEHAPIKKHTWSVPDGGDDNATHRGGQKHRKSKAKIPKAQGTGVNAIPVG